MERENVKRENVERENVERKNVKRENFFTLLKLDVNESDKETIGKAIDEFEKRQKRNLLRLPLKKKAQKNLKLVDEMKKVMLNDGKRKEEVADLEKRIKEETEKKESDLVKCIRDVSDRNSIDELRVVRIVERFKEDFDENRIRNEIKKLGISIFKARPEPRFIEPCIMGEICRGLDLTGGGDDDLYAFLGLRSRERDVERIRTKIEDKENEAISIHNDPKTLAKRDLVSKCGTYLIDEEKRKMYNNSLDKGLVESKMVETFKNLRIKGKMTQNDYKETLKEAGKLGVHPDVAEFCIKDFAERANIPIDEGGNSNLRYYCGDCNYPNDVNANICTNCGMNLYCSECNRKLGSGETICGGCGTDYSKVKEANDYITSNRLKEAIAVIAELENKSPSSPELLNLRRRIVPPPPRDLRASTEGNSIKLIWNENTGDIPSKDISYTIIRKKDSEPLNEKEGDVLSNDCRLTQFTDTKASKGVLYYYSVYSKYCGVALSSSGIVSTGVFIGEDVRDLQIVSGNNSARIAWVKPQNCDGVEIWRKEGEIPSGRGDGVCQRVSGTRYNDSYLKNDVTYGYLVLTCYNIGGRFSYSRGVSGTIIPRKPPEAIRDLELELKGNEIIANFTAPRGSSVGLYYHNGEIPYAEGDVVPLDEIESKYESVRKNMIVSGVRFSPRMTGMISVLPVCTFGSQAVVGRVSTVLITGDVKNVVVGDENGKHYVKFDWNAVNKVDIFYSERDGNFSDKDKISVTNSGSESSKKVFIGSITDIQENLYLKIVSIFSDNGRENVSPGIKVFVKQKKAVCELKVKKQPGIGLFRQNLENSRSVISFKVNVKAPDYDGDLKLVLRENDLPLNSSDKDSHLLAQVSFDSCGSGEYKQNFVHDIKPDTRDVFVRLFSENPNQINFRDDVYYVKLTV